ncbi:MAG: acetylxylan esterase [Prevotella sp.]|nr:acetylxylan esterase [Prevotella sp.]
MKKNECILKQSWLKSVAVLIAMFLVSIQQVSAENYPYRSDYLWLTVPNHADWLYQTGEKAKVEVTFLRYGIPQDVELTYEIGPDELPATTKGKVLLKNGRATIDMGTLKTPGFLDLRLTAMVDGSKAQHHVKVGFSPEKLQPYTQNPADFDDFWKAAIAEARKTPVSVDCEPAPEYSNNKVDAFLLKIRTDRRHSIYGYLLKPKSGSGKYPVVMTPPGAGIKTIKNVTPEYTEQGMIRLMIEIHGLHPKISDKEFQEISTAFSDGNGYLENGLDQRDNYYMKHVYVACVRAIDYLTSLPEWDGKNVFVQGGSQGGALSLITAALDSRVTACVANHPALSDMAGYAEKGRTGGYPHFNRQVGMLTPEKIKNLAYYDVVNFARRIQCPVYLTWGYNDDVCPPTTSYIVWNQITAPKEALLTPINEHWTTGETNRKQVSWLKNHIK